MFINPKKAISEGWLKGIPKKDIQPNAVDISVDSLFTVSDFSTFELYKDSKIHRQRTEAPFNLEENWVLPWKGAYDFTSPSYVEIPKGVVGWLVTRSTLNRNGIFVLSGLYDSGFKGHLCGTLYNMGGKAIIERGVTIAQFIMAESDSAGVYAGGYSVREGDLWHEKLAN